jgi:hypothetical protein
MITISKISVFIISVLVYNTTLGQNINIKKAHYADKPIVEMTVNNKKAWVLLDTGSAFTIFNSESEDKYDFSTHLSSDSEHQIQGLGVEVNHMYHVRNATLKFGEKRLWGPILAFDITNVAKSIHARTGKMITAIIGTNMMTNYGFIIDMGNRTVMMEYKDKKKYKVIRSKSIMAELQSKSHTLEN